MCMSIEDIVYPGFNKSLMELNCLEKIDDKTYKVLDFTDIEWVRSALNESALSIDNLIKLEFRKPTDEEMTKVLKKLELIKHQIKLKMLLMMENVLLVFHREKVELESLQLPHYLL